MFVLAAVILGGIVGVGAVTTRQGKKPRRSSRLAAAPSTLEDEDQNNDNEEVEFEFTNEEQEQAQAKERKKKRKVQQAGVRLCHFQ